MTVGLEFRRAESMVGATLSGARYLPYAAEHVLNTWLALLDLAVMTASGVALVACARWSPRISYSSSRCSCCAARPVQVRGEGCRNQVSRF